MSTFNGPFNGDVKPAPSPSKQCGNKFETSALNQPEDTGVLKTIFYDESESLKGAKPAPLESPFGNTFRPGVGRS